MRIVYLTFQGIGREAGKSPKQVNRWQKEVRGAVKKIRLKSNFSVTRISLFEFKQFHTRKGRFTFISGYIYIHLNWVHSFPEKHDISRKVFHSLTKDLRDSQGIASGETTPHEHKRARRDGLFIYVFRRLYIAWAFHREKFTLLEHEE